MSLLRRRGIKVDKLCCKNLQTFSSKLWGFSLFWRARATVSQPCTIEFIKFSYHILISSPCKHTKMTEPSITNAHSEKSVHTFSSHETLWTWFSFPCHTKVWIRALAKGSKKRKKRVSVCKMLKKLLKTCTSVYKMFGKLSLKVKKRSREEG